MKHKVYKRLGITALLCSFALITTSTSANWPIRMLDDAEVPSLAPLLETRIAAVVQISMVPESTARRSFSDPILNRFFRDQQREPKAHFSGSGVVIDGQNGYIITNHHVINEAAEVYVTLQDLRVFQATIVGSDEPTDVALLQIDAKWVISSSRSEIRSVSVKRSQLA